jgi:hypothetical protein
MLRGNIIKSVWRWWRKEEKRLSLNLWESKQGSNIACNKWIAAFKDKNLPISSGWQRQKQNGKYIIWAEHLKVHFQFIGNRSKDIYIILPHGFFEEQPKAIKVWIIFHKMYKIVKK